MRRVTFGLRMLFRTRFVSTIAILSLGLGIGANGWRLSRGAHGLDAAPAPIAG